MANIEIQGKSWSNGSEAAIARAVEIVLEAFRAAEEDDHDAERRLYHPDVEFHWPPSVPWGGSSRGVAIATMGAMRPGWGQTWQPFQTEDERKLQPRVVAASEREVVVLWQQRGTDGAGEHFDSPVLGLYEVRDGKFARAQMFYFDPVGAANFIAQARTRAAAAKHGTEPPSVVPRS